MSLSMTEAIEVGTRKQLFIDQRFVAEAEGVRRVVNPPVQHAEPVLTADRPWEALGISGYNTVLREADGRFRLWYAAAMKSGLPQEGAIRLCYAESTDGLHWHKPALGLLPFQGSMDNNIVAPPLERQSQQGATVFRDERAPAEQRYRLWTKFRPTDKEVEEGMLAGLYAMHSPDGLHWSIDPDQPNPPTQASDTQNMCFWDDRLHCYVGYTRVRDTQSHEEAAKAGRGRYRAIGRITSPDFRTWSDTEIVMQADEDDLSMPVPGARSEALPVLDYYTSCAMKYPEAQDVYIALPSIYYHWGEDEFPATMDVQLHVSRDGIDWQRPGDREPFLRHGMDGRVNNGMLFANPWLVPMGEELWFYYTGRGHRHGEAPDGPQHSALFRASLRRDGFISLDAGYHGGAFTTPPITFTGDHLELNCDGSAGGWLKVQILDDAGEPLPGRGFDDADAVCGNAVRKTVTWGGRADVGELVGRPVRLRFTMRAMKLYAFQFAR